ncbi:MAG TPA: BadF/BadG/BcrA/BcrD ATPase family protein, partial [Verrucomicrobiae bacterium]|nr:BadF/BadG/BcrA/BcrD ATPase family protein [Verrucomicrobiae bacterium]
MAFLVGLDCGGAKTAAAVCDAAGRIIARARGPGSAIVGLPGESFFGVIEPLLEEVLKAAGVALNDVTRVGMGLSGVDFADETRVQADYIGGRLGLRDRLVLVNDGLIALWGASAGDRVVLVQHGSGVTTAYRDGLGHEAIFDSLDVAHVFDLRRAAVSRTARMIDGREPATSLKERVLAHCDVAAVDFAEWYFRDPLARPRCSALAAVVFEAWRQDDAVAIELVEAAANDYVLTAQTMGQRLGDGAF